MRIPNPIKASVVVCVVLFAAGFVLAEDWPQWRGANRDGKVSEFKAPSSWPSELTEKWSINVGAGNATPALVGDKLYVFARQGDEEVTLCLDAATGKEFWRESYEAQKVTGPAGGHAGPRSSPAVADGKVVNLGVGGVLSCLDMGTGKVVWRKDPYPGVVPKFYTSSSPIIVDGMAVAQLGGAGNGAIIAYDLASGDQKWKWDAAGPEYASPVLLTAGGAKQIVTLTEKSVVGIGAADGKLLWELPFATARRAYNAATPVVDGQTVIYAGAGRGTHAVKIEKAGDGFKATEVWSNGDLAPQYNTPVLCEGKLYGITDRGNLFCINAQTGKTAWTDETRYERGFGTIVGAGKELLVLPSSSELVVFGPNGEKYSEVARYKVAETPTYAYPVVSGNAIYVKGDESLTMWTL